MALSQEGRGAAIRTPLGPDVVVLRKLSFDEELNTQFWGTAELLSEDFDLQAGDILGQEITVTLETQAGERFFNAIVAEFHFSGTVGTKAAYQAVLRPWTWVMGQRADCRIFQEMTAPEIIERVVRDAGFLYLLDISKLSDPYPKRNYCVQYNESDTNFIYRLMGEEGITSYFEHVDGMHTLILQDWSRGMAYIKGYEELQFLPETSDNRAGGEHVYSWQWKNVLVPGLHQTKDYDFLSPQKDMFVSYSYPSGYKHDSKRVFEWPGNFSERNDGERYARVRLEQLQTNQERAYGRSTARGLAVGRIFDLTGFPRKDQNKPYLLLTVHYEFQVSAYESLADGDSPGFECNFTCASPKIESRPERTTSRSVILGPQTAIVVGPFGEEIWTDEHGRVKVQFHWDRYGKKDDGSSCWIRVAQSWAGNNWGSQRIPRIGQEVVVEFLDGNPDSPIITGAVYNGDNKPPFSLPENKTQSGIRSNSTKDDTGMNELMFEDKKGKEQVYLHAERNEKVRIKNTAFRNVGRDQKTNIGNDLSISVGNDYILEAENKITLKCGDSEITMDSKGNISLNGMEIKVRASTQLDLDGGILTNIIAKMVKIN